MRNTERMYVSLFGLFLVMIFYSLYLVFTIHLYPYNYVWFMAAMVLVLVGFMRDLIPAMIVALFVLFGYGSYILYKLYVEQSVGEVSVNDLVWLFSFPVASIVAGLTGRYFRHMVKEFHYYEDNYEKNAMLDEITGFLNARSYFQELEEEVSRAVRYNRQVSVLLIEIAYYRELIKEYGKEQAEDVLQRMSVFIEEVLRDVDKKAYLYDGMFAAILPETPEAGLEVAKKRMMEKFAAIPLTGRVKKERQIHLKFKFGSSVCPDQGTEADVLYEKAKQELGLYVN